MNEFLQIIKRTQSSLRDTQFYKDCIAVVKSNSKIRYERIVMLGIGNFSSSSSSSLQLAFGLLLIEEFSISNAFIYDPIMVIFEIEACASLGLTITSSQRDIHEADTKTLFFMPHCPYQLYSQILWTNWGENLCNLEILGNRCSPSPPAIINSLHSY